MSKLIRMCNITIFIKVNPKMKKTDKEFQDSENREFNPGWTPSEHQSLCHCPGHVPKRQAVGKAVRSDPSLISRHMTFAIITI